MARFRDHFSAYSDRYVLIGGAAVDLLMDRAGIDFRVTKDLDVVLLVESLDAEFGAAFWEFVKAGGYEHRNKGTQKPCFYRFDTPTDGSFPYMIELFAKRDDLIGLPPEATIRPLPVADGVSSLSAIMLDEDYYEFVRSSVITVDGVPLLGAAHLIPLKARAWVDLTARRDRGEPGYSDAIKKHRADVVRLYQLLAPVERVVLPRHIAADLTSFLDKAFMAGYDPSSVGVSRTTIDEVIGTLLEVFGLKGDDA
ncbi:MAG: hypothetical protein ABFC80_00615 [Coriobacteriales bacterium]